MEMPATPEARASGFRYCGTLPMRTQFSAGRPTAAVPVRMRKTEQFRLEIIFKNLLAIPTALVDY
jgi:hypothetical protein